MKWAVVSLTLLTGAWLCAAPTNSPAKKKTTQTAAKSKTAAKAHTTSAKLTNARYVKGKRGNAGHTARAAAGSSYQTHPEPARYQEIQKALADRGYFKGEANGDWSGDSVDALKRFQTDQKLDPDGKINAHTLIGLGLGPKHDGSVGNSNLVPVVQPPPEPVSAPPASEEAAPAQPTNPN